jgi:hypothetical protein
VELLPDTCNYMGPYRLDPDESALLEFWYPYPKAGIIHLANQKQIRFDPAATVTLLDPANRPHQVNPRFGLLQAAGRGAAGGSRHAVLSPRARQGSFV